MAVQTAEEFLDEDPGIAVYQLKETHPDLYKFIKENLIEFAKIHVEACKKETKKAAYVKDPITGMAVYASSKRLNKAYPLSKIK